MKIGVLGAGQLGRMLALAGYPLDLQFVFLDPADQPCSAPLGEHIQLDYLDEAALQRFAAACDVATYELKTCRPARPKSSAPRSRCTRRPSLSKLARTA